MPKNTLAIGLHWEMLSDQGWEFFCDVAIHPVVLAPRLLGSIHIKPCSTTKIPIIIFTGSACVTRTCIRCHEYHPILRGKLLCPCFDNGVLFSTSQTR